MAVNVTSFGATGDGVSDDTAAIQQWLNYICESGQSGYWPAGKYVVSSGLVVNLPNRNSSGSLTILGDGGQTIVIAQRVAGPIITLNTNQAWGNRNFIFSGIQIKGSGAPTNQIGLLANGGTAGLHLSDIIVDGCGVGFKFIGQQFCVFRSLVASFCNVGCHLTQQTVGGGGNSSSWYDCYFSANKVGLVMDAAGPWPFTNNRFISLLTNSNTVCAVYINGASPVSIENWAPEGNGNGPPSYSYDNKLIKNGILHIERSTVVLRDYTNVSNTNQLIVMNGSNLTIDGGNGAGIVPNVDASSNFAFTDSFYGYYKGVTNSILTKLPLFVSNGMSRALTLPVLTAAPWLPNDAIGVAGTNVDCGYWSGGTTCGASYEMDPYMGSVAQFTFTDNKGGGVITTLTSGRYPPGARVAFSMLVKSSSSAAVFDYNLAQNVCNGSLQLFANQWARLVLFGECGKDGNLAFLMITPKESAVDAKLQFCKLQVSHGLDQRTLARFFSDGLYNSGLVKNIEPR